MKILHLNTYEANGGAGKAAERLNRALIEAGTLSKLAVNFSFNPDTTAYSFSGNILSRTYAMACMLAEQVYTKSIVKPIGVPFSTSVLGRDISKHPWVKEADILHIHWINHGFLSMHDLEKLMNLGKPIVYTTHDTYPFTGGCHVRYDCLKYQHGCGNCPDLKTSSPKDESYSNWKKKERIYKLNNFTVISPSKWMRDRAAESPLINNHRIRHIANCVDTRIFLPLKKSIARESLGLNPDAFIILAGFMPSRSALHKGGEYLWKALQLLSQSTIASQIQVIFMGNKAEDSAGAIPEIGLPVKMMGVLDSDTRLAQAYAAADVFLSASIEESLGYTAIESLSCGTPVVAFHTSGLLDVVEHRKNGYLAELRSAEDLARGIEWIATMADRVALSAEARTSIVNTFSFKQIAAEHLQVYKELYHGR